MDVRGHLSVEVSDQERKSSPKRKFLERTSRGHPGVIRADIPAKTLVGAVKIQRIAKGAGGKGPRQKTSKSVKKSVDTFRQFSRRAKNVKNRQKVPKIFSTIFARHQFSGPF